MNVRLQHNLVFTAGVHYHGQLIMNNYLLKAYMITNYVESEQVDMAFERLKFFVNEELDSTIFINKECKEECRLYAAAGIKVTTIPNEPVDQIVGVMIFHKLNAIMEGRISVVETELSSTIGDNVVYIHSENELTNDLDIPAWWTTPDLNHSELDVLDSDKVFAIPYSGPNWDDLDLAWPNEEPKETGNIVFADFKQDETK